MSRAGCRALRNWLPMKMRACGSRGGEGFAPRLRSLGLFVLDGKNFRRRRMARIAKGNRKQRLIWCRTRRQPRLLPHLRLRLVRLFCALVAVPRLSLRLASTSFRAPTTQLSLSLHGSSMRLSSCTSCSLWSCWHHGQCAKRFSLTLAALRSRSPRESCITTFFSELWSAQHAPLLGVFLGFTLAVLAFGSVSRNRLKRGQHCAFSRHPWRGTTSRQF
mmetsp:Transcript_2789/g.7679  ORF Transcript_2789/g.7679 Transcript_2789/m.7679 type:complete len:218 (+) Transcript_2789:106-759(+)